MNESEGATTGSAVTNEGQRVSALRLAPGERRSVPADQLKELTEEPKQIIELMVHGLDDGGTIEGEFIEAGTPLTLHQACKAVGVRVRRMREIYKTQLFQAELNREIVAQRNAEKPKNLKVAKAIRDDPGDGSAAFATARLKAIQVIEGKDGGTSVNVQINNTQTTNNVSPGYVIKLPGTQPANEPKTIEGQAIEIEGSK